MVLGISVLFIEYIFWKNKTFDKTDGFSGPYHFMLLADRKVKLKSVRL